jgi:hypothetical protein
MQQEVPQLRFATVRLASGPRVHYAEQGDDSERPSCCYTVEEFAGDVVAFLDAVGVGTYQSSKHPAETLPTDSSRAPWCAAEWPLPLPWR